MSPVRLGLLIVGALLAQSTLFARLPLAGVRPDLLLLLTAFAGLQGGRGYGAAVGFAGGLLLDLVAGRLIGLGALAKACTGYVAGALGSRLFRDNPVVVLTIVAVGTLLDQAVFLLGAKAFGYPLVFWHGMWRIALPLAWYHALLVPFFYGLFRRLWGADDEPLQADLRAR